MSRRLVLYIGQDARDVAAMQTALMRAGAVQGGPRVLFPAPLGASDLAHHAEAFARDGSILAGTAAHPDLERLPERLARGGFDVAMVGLPGFDADPDAVAAAVDGFLRGLVETVTVICYPQPHAARIVAEFAAQVADGAFDGTLADFVAGSDAGRYLLAERMAAWAAAFGESFVARPAVAGALAGGTPENDLAQVVFGPEAGAEPQTEAPLCIEDLALLRLVQTEMNGATPALRRDVAQHLAKRLRRAAGGGTRLALDTATAGRIDALYRADAEALDAGVLRAHPVMAAALDACVATALPTPQSLDPAEYFSPDDLRSFATLVRMAGTLAGNDARRWGDLLGSAEPRIDHPDPVLRATALAALEASDPGTETPDLTTLDDATLRSLIAFLPATYAARDALSRQFGDAVARTRRAVTLRPAAVAEAAASPDIAPETRDMLEELFVTLFFARHAPALTRPRAPMQRLRNTLLGPSWGADRARAETLAPQHAALVRAGVLYLCGEIDAAYEQFDLARLALIEKGELRHQNRGLLAMRRMARYRSWAAGPTSGMRRIDMPSDARFVDERPIVAVALDAAGLKTHAAKLIAASAAWCNLHVHVCNPGDAALPGGDGVRVSLQTAPAGTHADVAAAGLLHARALLHHYDRPILFADSAALTDMSRAALFDAGKRHDLLLATAPDRQGPLGLQHALPWQRIDAGLLLANPTEGAAAFLTLYERLFDRLAQDDLSGPLDGTARTLLAVTADLVGLDRPDIAIKTV